jgi:hypothetical protein
MALFVKKDCLTSEADILEEICLRRDLDFQRELYASTYNVVAADLSGAVRIHRASQPSRQPKARNFR